MYLLDTNHCSRIIFGDTNVLKQLQAHIGLGVATSVIVRGELIFMAQKSQQQTRNLQQVKHFFQAIDLYPITPEVADIYGILKGEIINILGPKDRAKRRTATIQNLGFSENDLWIAATALHYNLTIVSDDSDFYRLQQIKTFPLESWTSPI